MPRIEHRGRGDLNPDLTGEPDGAEPGAGDAGDLALQIFWQLDRFTDPEQPFPVWTEHEQGIVLRKTLQHVGQVVTYVTRRAWKSTRPELVSTGMPASFKSNRIMYATSVSIGIFGNTVALSCLQTR